MRATPLELGKSPYLHDFSSLITRDYLTLQGKLGGYIRNTMEQLADSRARHVERHNYGPFQGSYFFKGDVAQEGPSDVWLTAARIKGLLGSEPIGRLQMAFQRVGKEIQAGFSYENFTDSLPPEQQAHNAFGAILPFAVALCHEVADRERVVVVHAVRWPREKRHWSELLETVGYTLEAGGTAYVRKYIPSKEPHPQGSHVEFVKGQYS
ncbi:hypothetical protein A3A79_05675 [Candidatus Gottesmanbacteria bacterium RIFCSPLOWO2_01_FULL_43_11b]|uniref:Uncharacterized protein n=1 Tax=Candidatus Gottesmanbacteria bacterium RIFCSPLOWO2_01_FULL_43_11b TaxID=1798392 RepID=A0A1F6AK53_9BACT|nr:MAG: hypothetical protein A3A79_05675 [Candidatus Gottesmanbacteria bacterium RIFCSPLOWO2_01_FULL_43_11b]